MNEQGRERTAEIDYVGWVTMEEWFDDVVALFESHGCTVEGASDGPWEDGWYARWGRANNVILRLLAGWWPTVDGRWKRGYDTESMADSEISAIAAARKHAQGLN
jgi:hypothetical protein